MIMRPKNWECLNRRYNSVNEQGDHCKNVGAVLFEQYRILEGIELHNHDTRVDDLEGVKAELQMNSVVFFNEVPLYPCQCIVRNLAACFIDAEALAHHNEHHT